jgi:pre-mRNA-processing factor 40
LWKFNVWQELLNQLREQGELNALTKWKTIYPMLKDDERYLNMLGQSGSTPMELFRDLVGDLEDIVRHEARIVKDILKVVTIVYFFL